MTDCAICGELVPDDQWRWHCSSCGATLHYRCAPGGVPVAGPVVCPCEGCGERMAGVESRAAAEASGQTSLFG